MLVPVTAKVVAGEMVLVYIHKPAHRVLVERAVRPALFLLFQDVQNVDRLVLAPPAAVLDLTIHLIPVLAKIVQAVKLLQPLEKLVRLRLATLLAVLRRRLLLKKVMEVIVRTVVIVPRVRVEDQIVVVVKEDLVDVLIVIRMVIVPVAGPIITGLVFNVLHAVTVKQVHRDRHRLLPVLSY